MTLRLLSDGLDPLDLADWADGWVNTSVEVSSPAVRELVDDRSRADGTDDRTSNVGARAVTVSIDLCQVPHTRQELLDRVAPFLHPARRSTLEFASERGQAPRRLTVRPDDTPIEWARPTHLELTWSFRTVGTPWWLGEARTLDLAAAAPPPGRTYDLTFPRSYPPAPSSIAAAVNAGTWSADWVLTIVGPARRPRLRNEDTGEAVVLRGLELLDGQVAVIDSAARSVTVDGQRRYGVVDHGATTWWAIPPGVTPVSLPVAAATAAPPAVLAWSDAYVL